MLPDWAISECRTNQLPNPTHLEHSPRRYERCVTRTIYDSAVQVCHDHLGFSLCRKQFVRPANTAAVTVARGHVNEQSVVALFPGRRVVRNRPYRYGQALFTCLATRPSLDVSPMSSFIDVPMEALWTVVNLDCPSWCTSGSYK